MANNELTKVDVDKIKSEIAQREQMKEQLRAEVKRTRAFGDLSENDEYRSARREFNRNESRIEYLKSMLEHGVVIEDNSGEGVVGLFDSIEVFYPDEEDEEEQLKTVRIVTSLRNDVLNGCISKDSPFGQAVLGRKVGETVIIKVNDKYSYPIVIRSVTKMDDDDSLKIRQY